MARGPSSIRPADISATASGPDAGNASLARSYCARAESLLNLDQLDEARKIVNEALRLAPRDPAAFNILGVIELEKGNFAAAAAAIKRAVELQPDSPEPRHYLGVAYQHLGRHEDAVASFRAALLLRPTIVPTLLQLAKLLKILGRHDEAKEILLRLIAVNPGDTEALFELVDFAPQALSDDQLALLEKTAADMNEGPKRRAVANFTLASLHQARGEFDAEFARLKQANDLSRDLLTKLDGKASVSVAGMPANAQRPLAAPAKALQQISDMRAFIEATFDADFMRRYEGAGHPSSLPIFIVGMPRSGSSLIEQILASHPLVFGAGEIETFQQIAVTLQWPYEGYHSRNAFDVPRREPPPRHFRTLGANYVKALREFDPRARHIVNKALGNYMNIGMIHLCLPNAVILHAVRDPVDTCLGCYRRHFLTGNETTYDLTMLGRHYQEYRRVMAHWQSVLPGRVADVVYEELVADPEGQIRRLLALCGLPWDERCLRSHETARPVRTASVNQVRRPIYRDLQRWRRYERHLKPLFDALGPYAPQAGKSERS